MYCHILVFALSSHNIGEVILYEGKTRDQQKPLKGEDGYKTFSIRIRDDTVNHLEELSQLTNRSRNELINILLDYAIENCEVR